MEKDGVCVVQIVTALLPLLGSPLSSLCLLRTALLWSQQMNRATSPPWLGGTAAPSLHSPGCYNSESVSEHPFPMEGLTHMWFLQTEHLLTQAIQNWESLKHSFENSSYTPGLRPQNWWQRTTEVEVRDIYSPAVEDEGRTQKESFTGRGVKASCVWWRTTAGASEAVQDPCSAAIFRCVLRQKEAEQNIFHFSFWQPNCGYSQTGTHSAIFFRPTLELPFQYNSA